MRARRAELRDEFHHGDESVVMAGANVARLSVLATYLLGQMSDWRTSDELVSALTDRFGEPDESNAADVVAATLTELASLEIVEVERD